MLQLIHQNTEPQTITQQDKLVLELRALLPRARQELDRFVPLCMRELRLAGKGVQVVNQGGEYLQVTRGGGKGLMEGVHTVQTSGVAEIVRMWRSESIGNITLLLTVEWKRWYDGRGRSVRRYTR